MSMSTSCGQYFSRSSSVASRACRSNVSFLICTCTLGLALRLRYHIGFFSLPPLGRRDDHAVAVAQEAQRTHARLTALAAGGGQQRDRNPLERPAESLAAAAAVHAAAVHEGV